MRYSPGEIAEGILEGVTYTAVVWLPVAIMGIALVNGVEKVPLSDKEIPSYIPMEQTSKVLCLGDNSIRFTLKNGSETIVKVKSCRESR